MDSSSRSCIGSCNKSAPGKKRPRALSWRTFETQVEAYAPDANEEEAEEAGEEDGVMAILDAVSDALVG